MGTSHGVLSLVRSMGLPGLIEGEAPPLDKILNLLQLAEQNKTPLLFLEHLRKTGRHLPLEAQLEWYRDKRKKTLDLTALVSGLLKELSIRYVIFKTFKPFPYTPTDIDILLWSTEDLARASQTLENMGLKFLEKDLYGLNLFSADHALNVDLTTEIAVSSFIYLDKNILFKHANRVEVDGFKVNTLKPHADLVAVAAHCMYKEQMYTLSDYYTFALSSRNYQEALELAEHAHARFPLETALKLTYDTTVNAFGSDNNLLERLEHSLQKVDTNRMIQTGNDFNLPVKYPPGTVLRGLSKKLLEDPVSRNSLPTALKSTLQPKRINRLLEHITRKQY